jgi:hypothetical protein
MMSKDMDSNLETESADGSQKNQEPREKTKWGKTVKVSLGVLGGLGLLFGYVSAAGMHQSEQEAGARKAVDDFFAALNARNLEAARKALHYPHVHFAGHEAKVWNEPTDFHIDFDALAATEGWHHSTLDLCIMRQSSEDKIHFEIQYSRHKADSGRYATYQSVWIVTRKEGRWGIQCRSILSS